MLLLMNSNSIISIVKNVSEKYILKEEHALLIDGIGIDIVELERIEHVWRKNKERFITRILSEAERAKFNEIKSERRKVEFLAGRFAAKEAFAKATGNGIGEIRFSQIEILSNEKGAPILKAPYYDEDRLFVSISHSEAYAVAQVIITKK